MLLAFSFHPGTDITTAYSRGGLPPRTGRFNTYTPTTSVLP